MTDDREKSTRGRARRVRELFDAACELPAGERRPMLERECGDDLALRAELVELLEHADDATEHDAIGAAVRAAAGRLSAVTDGAAPGGTIGPYRLLRPLGEGGFATVWLAEQTEPIRRQVALKLIKPGMDSREILARFAAEQQVLARLDHPGIAYVIDAGQTSGGRPYFVLEHVDGPPITEYCRRHDLALRPRLELFARICDAVQHAHLKGIIHRDLKPSNVLVVDGDDGPQPKVIDFGIAKALGERPHGAPAMTSAGAILGTPAYMSPEQAASNPVLLDTRADIYSLGALLYELLTGEPPFGHARFADAGLGEILRILENEPPLAPSRAAHTMPQADAGTTTIRSAALRGELDWIVMKALEKDVERRYAVAGELAADLRRYLTNQPVLAGPPSATYRLRKFVRRNRGRVTAAALLGGVALFGLGSTVWQGARAIRAERVALERQQEAQRQRAVAEAINEFLTRDLLASARPAVGGIDITVREVLDDAAGAVTERFAGQPEVEARVLQTLGRTYVQLGEYAAAETLLDRALGIVEGGSLDGGPFGDDARVEAMEDVGRVYHLQDRHDEALSLLEPALALARQGLGPAHATTLVVEQTLARVLERLGRTEEAQALAEANLAATRERYGAESRETLEAVDLTYSLRMIRRDTGDATMALGEEWLRLAKAIHGEESSFVLDAMYAVIHLRQRRHEGAAALPLGAEHAEASERVFGAQHPNTLHAVNLLATLWSQAGRHDEAERIHRENLAARIRWLGPEHGSTASSHHNLAASLRNQRRYEEAIPEFERSVEILRGTIGIGHRKATHFAMNLAEVYVDAGRYDEALALIAEVLAAQEETDPADRYVVRANAQRGRALAGRGDHAEGERLLLDAHPRLVEVTGAEHRWTRVATRWLAELYEATGRVDEAATWRATLARAEAEAEGHH